MNPEINLLPVFEKRKPESYLGLILFIVVLGALIIFLAFYLMGLKQDAADLAAEEQNLIAQRNALQSQTADTTDQPEITYADAVLFVETNSYPVSPLYEDIQRLVNENMYIRNYKFNPTQIELAIDFETKAELAQFIEGLLKSNFFEDVYVNDISELLAIEPQGEEGIAEKENLLPEYTATVILIPLSEYLAVGGTQP